MFITKCESPTRRRDVTILCLGGACSLLNCFVHMHVCTYMCMYMYMYLVHASLFCSHIINFSYLHVYKNKCMQS